MGCIIHLLRWKEKSRILFKSAAYVREEVICCYVSQIDIVNCQAEVGMKRRCVHGSEPFFAPRGVYDGGEAERS